MSLKTIAVTRSALMGLWSAKSRSGSPLAIVLTLCAAASSCRSPLPWECGGEEVAESHVIVPFRSDPDGGALPLDSDGGLDCRERCTETCQVKSCTTNAGTDAGPQADCVCLTGGLCD